MKEGQKTPGDRQKGQKVKGGSDPASRGGRLAGPEGGGSSQLWEGLFPQNILTQAGLHSLQSQDQGPMSHPVMKGSRTAGPSGVWSW